MFVYLCTVNCSFDFISLQQIYVILQVTTSLEVLWWWRRGLALSKLMFENDKRQRRPRTTTTGREYKRMGPFVCRGHHANVSRILLARKQQDLLARHDSRAFLA